MVWSPEDAREDVMARLLLAAAVSLVVATPALAWDVYGAIGAKYAELGGPAGPLGEALSSEAPAADGGRFNNFRNGFIYWHKRTGAHAVYGLIGQKWAAAGKERGFGYPLTDESPAANGGRFNDFANNATITFHPRVGANAIYGDIRVKWIARGREAGSCGYPLKDEHDYNGGRRQEFTKGAIDWRPPHRIFTSCGAFNNDVELHPVRE